MIINITLDEKSLEDAIRKVEDYSKDLKNKTSQLVDDVANQVKEYAALELSHHIETGETIASLQKEINKGGFTAHILVGGAAVWLEFGTGVVANPVGVGGYVHPKGAELGMSGIGTFGNHNGSNPDGWWYYDENGRRRHTFGIPATMFMWNSAQAARRDIPYLARRIWS